VPELKVADAANAADRGPTEHEIRQRAHEIYLRRAGAPGNPELDWLQAEIELRACKTTTRPD
jgi:hypothetical protein